MKKTILVSAVTAIVTCVICCFIMCHHYCGSEGCHKPNTECTKGHEGCHKDGKKACCKKGEKCTKCGKSDCKGKCMKHEGDSTNMNAHHGDMDSTIMH